MLIQLFHVKRYVKEDETKMIAEIAGEHGFGNEYLMNFLHINCVDDDKAFKHTQASH